MRFIPGAACLMFCAILAASCAAATPAASAAPATAQAAASTSPARTGITFKVGPSSKATLKVREQLANVAAPSDAILTTNAVSGSFTLLPDGTFTPDSKIAVDLRTLKSDRTQRDQFIQRNPLETATFPNAEFVPKRTAGLALPLAATGDLTFTITGSMTIHGTAKDVTLDVTAKRAGADLTATATNATSPWKFADFGLTPPSVFVVISIVDRLDMQIDLVATEVR